MSAAPRPMSAAPARDSINPQSGQQRLNMPRPTSAMAGRRDARSDEAKSQKGAAAKLGARDKDGVGLPLRPASAMGNINSQGASSRLRPSSALSRLPKRPASALGKLGGGGEGSTPQQGVLGSTQQQGGNAQDNRAAQKGQHPKDERVVHSFASGAVEEKKMRPRPYSALSRIPASSLSHPLHPMETLGRGLGSDIAVDSSSAAVLADRALGRKTGALVEALKARPLPLDPLLAELRREMEEEEAANAKVWEEDEEDEDEGSSRDRDGKPKVKNITDLRPAEMSRLEHRFKKKGAEHGLVREDFEAVMREFTGMEGKLGGQLFCKIDANDDGTVEWDEFLEYIGAN